MIGIKQIFEKRQGFVIEFNDKWEKVKQEPRKKSKFLFLMVPAP